MSIWYGKNVRCRQVARPCVRSDAGVHDNTGIEQAVEWNGGNGRGGFGFLTTLTEHRILFPDGLKISTIPSPSEQNKKLLEAAGITLPPFLASNDITVATYKHNKKTS